MSVSVQYPRMVELEDGSLVDVTRDTWEDRQLVVETDRSVEDVRRAFAKDGFKETVMEYNKPGRIGHGMVKKYKDWQVHVRFFRRGSNIQIDGEVEVSQDYFEHLGHGWIPALKMISETISNHLGTARIYHSGYQKYVKNTVREHILELGDPESKTSVALSVAGVVTAVAACLLLAWSRKT